jgi:hypothetical protein
MARKGHYYITALFHRSSIPVQAGKILLDRLWERETMFHSDATCRATLLGNGLFMVLFSAIITVLNWGSVQGHEVWIETSPSGKHDHAHRLGLWGVPHRGDVPRECALLGF